MMNPADRLIRIYLSNDVADAQLICNMLEDAGIRAVVKGGLLGNARGEIPFGPGTAPGVWVFETDGPAARKLIDEQQTAPIGPDWQCPRCGEHIEGQFAECWNCAADEA